MSIKLYYDIHTRAGRVRWLLEELDVDYQLERVDRLGNEHKQPDYVRRHPLGKIPALEVDGQMMMESGAMLVYLADRFASGGLSVPLDSPSRAPYLQWIFFTACTLEPGLVEYWYHTIGKPEAERDPAQAQKGLDDFHAAARVAAAHLADREYMVDDRLTTADIAVASVLGLARGLGQLEPYPVLVSYGRRLGSRPAAKRSRAD